MVMFQLQYPSDMFIVKFGISEIVHHSDWKEYIDTKLSEESGIVKNISIKAYTTKG